MSTLFISDLHLQPTHQKTTQAFLNFLSHPAKQAKELYILGDLFEFWAGDEMMGSEYIQAITQAIRSLVDAGITVFWIAGNRDFLVGEQFVQASGMTLLSDTHIASIHNQKVILMHGDAQCIDDKAYMQFRAMVRSPAWQQQFLAMPLTQRMAMIEGMCQKSKQENQENETSIMDEI